MSRRWFWVALVGVVVSAVVGAALLVTAIVLGSTDAPGLIDDPAVLATIEDECKVMTSEVEGTDRGSAPDRLAATIREQNGFVETMVEQIGSLPQGVLSKDRPTAAWLEDWRQLVAVRESYADSLAGEGLRTKGLQIPRDSHGSLITVRMEEALLDPVCDVPKALLDPRRGSTSSV